MCGIFLYISSEQIKGKQKIRLTNLMDKLVHRGPDQKQIKYYNDNVMMGFHRLAIVDPEPAGLQPFENGRYSLICNGEIYCYKKLKQYLADEGVEIKWKTHCDCEVILHLLDYLVKHRMGDNLLDHCLYLLCKNYLDGEYSLVVYDNETEIVHFVTDELSMRPLFIGKSKNPDLPGYFIASEQKAMVDCCDRITRLSAGSYGYIGTFEREKFQLEPSDNFRYVSTDSPKYIIRDPVIKQYNDLTHIKIVPIEFDQAVAKLRELLIDNVIVKLNPDREFVFLLSGGIDSSLGCAIAAKYLAPTRIRTFTVGFSTDATDILAARKVAAHIDSIHTEFICTYQEGIDILPFVIYHNESWDQTTTRASIVMSLCVKKIREKHPDVAVVFSGEVADEMLRGYLYNRKCPNLEEGRKDQIMRLRNLHTSDGLRADRVCASYSMECRFFFFSKDLVKFSLSLPPEYLDPKHNHGIEKYILRVAFDCDNYLPHDILWRTKNAFSDSTSVKSSWKEQLISYCNSQVTDSRFSKRKSLYPYCTPETKEDMYYRELFDEFGYDDSTIPYKWMPSWCDDVTDSSATALDVFEEDQQ